MQPAPPPPTPEHDTPPAHDAPLEHAAPPRRRLGQLLTFALVASVGWMVYDAQRAAPERTTAAVTATPDQPPPQARPEPFRRLSGQRLAEALAPSSRRLALTERLTAALAAPYARRLREASGRIVDFAIDLTDVGSTAKRLGMSVQDWWDDGDRVDRYVRGHFEHYLPLEQLLAQARAEARAAAGQALADFTREEQQRAASLLGELQVEPPEALTRALAADPVFQAHLTDVSRDSLGRIVGGAALGLATGAALATQVLELGALLSAKTLGVSVAVSGLVATVIAVARNDAEEEAFREMAQRTIEGLQGKAARLTRSEGERLAAEAVRRLEDQVRTLAELSHGRAIGLPADHHLTRRFSL